MTGYESKRSAARDKLLDDDDALTIAYQSGFYDGKKAAQRPWVGLTDEEMYLNCPIWLSQEQCKVLIQQIEDTLRSKNT